MSDEHPRLARERKTVHVMIGIYYRANHDSLDLCAECSELSDYTDRALERCPYHEEKPTCTKCPIHCYSEPMREKVKVVMRYSGPRMLLRHPILAIRHKLNGSRKAPEREKG